MLKRILTVSAAAIGFVLVVVLGGGALTPRNHLAASSLLIQAGIDTVWATVSDIAAMPDWWQDLERVERAQDPADGEVWTHYMSTGQIDIAVESVAPPLRLVTRIVADESAPFGGTWTYELTEEGGGTRVTVTEDGYVNNLVFRFVMRIVGPHGTMDSYLRDLARHFGQEAEAAHVS